MPRANANYKPQLLLVDDDSVFAEVASTLLRLHGYGVDAVTSGEEALARLEGSPRPAVLLVDVQMPGISGVELYYALRKRSNAMLVAMSASEPEAAIRAATDGFLLKPFAPEAVDKLLQGDVPKSLQAPTSVEAAILDPATMLQLRSMMPPAALSEIFDVLLIDLAKRLDELDGALEAGDLHQAARVGHAIKGGAAITGAVELSRIGASVEQAGLNSDAADGLASARTLAKQMRTAMARLKGMIDVELGN